MNDFARPRTNRDGHPCPPWCATDHDREVMPGAFLSSHSAEITHVRWIIISAVAHTTGSRTVQVCVPGADGGSIFLDAGNAQYLALMVEALEGATSAQHRELAAAIRKAAAVITEG